ncbi:hypothetical protein MH928_07515 [Flavobacterium sp. WW92]|uniref:hypothetical protein n=1 Tax=unclassified Flavobacterium TaxID=196869 RepID=UPI002224AAB8|nr:MULTISPECIES: hypothetical protein [unclassified Flavobacterium]WDO14535.1 hypothetical protein MH928_07515 [Flavobacterium sp. WW92]
MQINKREQIQKVLKRANRLLWIGIPICIIAPFACTQLDWINFNTTGPIGDTIGGTTAPFINVMAAILVFLALRAQIDANLLIQDQIDRQEIERKLDIESQQLNQYYNNLKSSLDNFEYKNIDLYAIEDQNLPTYKGSEAIFKLIDDYFCNYHHEDDDDVRYNPKITELISMVEICDILLTKIKNSKIHDRETLWTLTKHQFIYRILPRISKDFPDKIDKYWCESCNNNHGFPEKLSKPIKNSNELINMGL